MATSLRFRDIGIGDILCDFRQKDQRVVHFLVVDRKFQSAQVVGHGFVFDYFFTLQPLDSSSTDDVYLCELELTREFSTWRKKG